jgi:glycosyltransferase involved in cell wall biosynthesis
MDVNMVKLENNNQCIKISFVSLSSYPIILKNNLEYIGGAEIQQVELAYELKKYGFKIFFITYGDNHNNFNEIDGIKIISTYGRYERNSLNFFNKSIIIWKRMKEVNSDIYIHRSGAPGIVTIFGLLHNKKIIKMVASNAEVTGQNIIKSSWISNCLQKIGNSIDFIFSDSCICQNDYQKTILKKKFGLNCLIIKNAFDIPLQEKTIKDGRNILWVGTIRRIKRPEIFLEIAKKLPYYKFLMIGGKGEDNEFYEKIVKEIKNIKNVDFVGFIPHNEILKYYKKSIILVNTSETEGFPNIFLEAWMNYMPVISLDIDPDDIIIKYNLGFHSGFIDQMIKDINLLMNDEHLLVQLGENARNYVKINHDIKDIIIQYINLIQFLIKNNKSKIKKFIIEKF